MPVLGIDSVYWLLVAGDWQLVSGHWQLASRYWPIDTECRSMGFQQAATNLFKLLCLIIEWHYL